MPHLWACFYVLIMRREISAEEFSSAATLERHIIRLSGVDRQRSAANLEKFVTTVSKNGFHRYFYLLSDDSKHFKRNRHVLLTSKHRGDPDDSEWDPTFEYHTSSESYAKGGEANADLNMNALESDGYSLRILEKLGGGATDNASDATLENSVTYDMITAKLEAQPQSPDRVEPARFGVAERRPIIFCDPNHDYNLICNHATVAVFGLAKKGEHRQCHHRQVLQSTHDLHTSDSMFSQWVMDHVMKDSGCKVQMRTARERDARWIANQRNSRWQLGKLHVKTADGVPSLVAWATYHANNNKSSDWRVVGSELASWYQMPQTILAFMFEAVLGEFFETATYYHCRKSSLKNRAAFRMLEMHDLLLDYTAPFWQKAKDSPETSDFKVVFDFLSRNFNGSQKELWKAKILDGISSGYDAHIKHTRYLFSCPLVFIVLRRSKEGPSLLKAMLAVMWESNHAPSNLKRSIRSGYAYYSYHRQNETRPPEEQRWYDLLKSQDEALVYWWRRFGLLANETIWADLKGLSKEKPGDREEGLVPFKSKYPVIYEFLDCTFGGMMSNTRLAEQVHGMLRWYLNDSQSIEYTDCLHQYRIDSNYQFQEDRRDVKNASVEEEFEVAGDGGGARSGSPRKRRRTNANETKSDAVLQSQQLLLSCRRYKGKPSGPSVSSIASRGVRGKDKKVADMKRAAHAKRNSARDKSADKDAAYFKVEAKRMNFDNENSWISQQGAKERALKEKLLTRSFWESVPNKIGLNRKLLRVFPCILEKDKMALSDPDWNKKMKRADIFTQILAPHLKHWGRVGDLIAEYLMDDPDYAKNVFRVEDIVQLWLHWWKLGPTRSSATDIISKDVTAERTQALLSANGTGVSTHYGYDRSYAKYFETVEMDLQELGASYGGDPEVGE